ncbi:MAG: GIY-YIG nuclease family protein [Dehalococcoidia bacterium]
MARTYYVYILTNRSQTLYVGVTNNIYRRLEEHRKANPTSFTARYHIDRLIYVEVTSDVEAALNREKQIKGWTRQRKMELIAEMNPEWRDLSEDWREAAT